MDKSLVLLGRAQGYLEAQPVGSPRSEYSRKAYERYARVGPEGFARWNVKPGFADHLVRSGIRMLALERLERGAELLRAALEAGDGGTAERAAAEVEECLAVLGQVRRRVRGPKGGLSRDGRAGPAAEVEVRG